MIKVLLFIEAALLSFLLTGAILRFSLKRRLLDIPNQRSSHNVAKPRLGGVAITLSFYVTCATFFLLVGWPFQSKLLGVGYLLGGGLLVSVGLVDDINRLDARVKIIMQILAAVIVVASGALIRVLRLPLVGSIQLGFISVPFTVLWILSLVNFYNFIDGIDGLAAGVAIIASFFLLAIGNSVGVTGSGIIFVILAGSSFGFLRYNFPPAKIFMGDAGSTFIGFTFAVMSIINSSQGIPAVVTVLLLAGVIGDTTVTLTERIIKRKKIFLPHRTHYYQRLTALGLSHKQVTLLEYLVAILLGISALFIFHSDRVFIAVLSIIWIGFFLWAIVKIRKMEQGEELFWRGKTLVIAVTDLIFIVGSYILSYYLRLNFRFTEAETASMLTSIPIVIVIRTFAFYYYGLYRGVWRYTSFNDLMKIVKAVTVSSVLMIVSFTFLFRFEAFPRSVFIIDWFILTVFLAGSRIAVRWFYELPSKDEVSGKRVIIGGTGATAELIIREMKRKGTFHPVGFLDDRIEMLGRTVQGLEVLGSFNEGSRIAQDVEVDEIIVIEDFKDRLSLSLKNELERNGIKLRIVSSPSFLDIDGVRAEVGDQFSAKSVMIAGKGSLIEDACSLFSKTDKLVVISDDARTVSELDRMGITSEIPVDIYGGILNSREYLGVILDKYEPDYILADYYSLGDRVANPIGSFVSTILSPLEKISGEAAKRKKPVLVVGRSIIRESDTAELEGILDSMLLGRFRDNPDGLICVKYDNDLSSTLWIDTFSKLPGLKGGVYRLFVNEDGKTELEEMEIIEETYHTERLVTRLIQNYNSGNEEILEQLVNEFGNMIALGKYES